MITSIYSALFNPVTAYFGCPYLARLAVTLTVLLSLLAPCILFLSFSVALKENNNNFDSYSNGNKIRKIYNLSRGGVVGYSHAQRHFSWLYCRCHNNHSKSNNNNSNNLLNQFAKEIINLTSFCHNPCYCCCCPFCCLLFVVCFSVLCSFANTGHQKEFKKSIVEHLFV